MKPWIERFWSKVEVTSSCWEWKGCRNKKSGYGYLQVGTRAHPTMRLAHRLAYELLTGPIPDGLDLDHLCRNRGCVNPAHLEPVTRRTNLLRGNTRTAQNAAKISCLRGHELSGTNVRISRKGQRVCRACHRMNANRYRIERKDLT